MNSQIKAIFFDIGGTLLLKNHKQTRDLEKIQKMMDLLQVTVPIEQFANQIIEKEQEYKLWARQTLSEENLSDRWVRFLGDPCDVNLIRLNAEQLHNLWTASKGEKHVDPEAFPVLNELVNRGYKIGTISHTSPKYIQETGIVELLSTSIHAIKFGRRKPHPSLFLAAANQCGFTPQECAYVGDRPSRDVIGSREAGIGLLS